MSGPIVRSGPSNKFSENWESVFQTNSTKKQTAAKAAKPAKAKKKAAKPVLAQKKAARKSS